MLTWTTALALAQAPTDEAIQAHVDRVYGKPVPKEAVCVGRPELGAPFQGSPVPVAVRRGMRGCVLLGVAIGDQWYTPEAALPAAVDRAAWDALDADAREEAWLVWVDEVLLAFAQPDEEGLAQVTVDAKKGVTVVDRRYLRRGDGAGRSEEVVGKWTFDKGLVVSGSGEQVLKQEDVSLFQRSAKVDGVEESVVEAAITSAGSLIRKCFSDAWEADLGLDGRVRLEWTLSGGKVSNIQYVVEEGTDDTLATCYARIVKLNAKWPAGTRGEVWWVFGIHRTEAK